MTIYTIYSIQRKDKPEHKYIGQTTRKCPKYRYHSHLYDLRNGIHDNLHLQHAWNKYGENLFEFVIRDQTAKSLNELNELEIQYIAAEGYYNIFAGGLNSQHTTETKLKIGKSKQTRQKLSEISKQAWKDPILREKMIKGMLKRPPLSTETKLKISNALKGIKRNPFSESHKEKMKKARVGQHRGESNPNAKLNPSQVLEIRRLHGAGCNKVKLAKQFGIGVSGIKKICYRITWKHI